mmetsp:Transcript_15884/g.41767  ORF Transcript_15884/g.41767 Transcript_15884/m.41767 type:complete len:213 (+) Transcript_15884:433-1071(+)
MGTSRRRCLACGRSKRKRPMRSWRRRNRRRRNRRRRHNRRRAPRERSAMESLPGAANPCASRGGLAEQVSNRPRRLCRSAHGRQLRCWTRARSMLAFGAALPGTTPMQASMRRLQARQRSRSEAGRAKSCVRSRGAALAHAARASRACSSQTGPPRSPKVRTDWHLVIPTRKPTPNDAPTTFLPTTFQRTSSPFQLRRIHAQYTLSIGASAA